MKNFVSNSANQIDPPESDIPEQLKDILQEVKQLKDIITTIDKNVDLIHERYTLVLTAAETSQIKQANDEIMNYTNEINKLSVNVEERLKKIAGDNVNNHCHTPEAEQRMRESIHSNLAKNLFNSMAKYQAIINKSTQAYKSKVESQVVIITGQQPTEEQLEKILESGPQNLYSNLLVQEKHHEDAMNVLMFLQARKQDLDNVEATISQLHQMFLDMATLVESQGDMIDQIEFNVKKS